MFFTFEQILSLLRNTVKDTLIHLTTHFPKTTQKRDSNSKKPLKSHQTFHYHEIPHKRQFFTLPISS